MNKKTRPEANRPRLLMLIRMLWLGDELFGSRSDVTKGIYTLRAKRRSCFFLILVEFDFVENVDRSGAFVDGELLDLRCFDVDLLNKRVASTLTLILHGAKSQHVQVDRAHVAVHRVHGIGSAGSTSLHHLLLLFLLNLLKFGG